MNSSYNMAPNETRTLEDSCDVPYFILLRAEVDLVRFEDYFFDVKPSEAEMISIVARNADTPTKKFILEQRDKINTWRKFKIRIKKHAQEIALETTLKQRQRPGEKTSTWLRRTIYTISFVGFETKFANMIIRETTNNLESRRLLDRFYFNRPDLAEIKDIIKDIERAEYDEEWQMNHKKMIKAKRYKQNSGSYKEQIKDSDIQSRERIAEENKIAVNFIDTDSKTNNIKKEKIKLNKESVDAIIDSGSEVNIVSKALVKLKAFPTMNTQKITLNNICGTFADVQETTILTIEMNDCIIHTPFLVVDTEKEDTVLLGYPTIEMKRSKRKDLDELIRKFHPIFDGKPSLGYEKIQCEIPTVPNKRVYVKYRSIPEKYITESKSAIKKLIDNGYIEPSTSSWCNPIRPVLKEDGSIRITSNMQFLNNLVEQNNYTIPHIQRVIEKTQGMKWFSVIDLKDGYFQIKLKAEDKYKTAFYFENKLYQWTRMPQGL